MRTELTFNLLDSDSDSSSSGSESELDSGVGPSKRKRRVPKTDKPRKQRNKGKGKAKAKPSPHNSDSDSNSDVEGIQVTLGRENAMGTGMYVDEVIRTSQAAECWDVPRKSHRVAYVVDFNATPECITSTVDAFIKKQVCRPHIGHLILKLCTLVPRFLQRTDWFENKRPSPCYNIRPQSR